MYYGDNDLLSTKENNLLLKSEMKNVVLRQIPLYGHLTYFWSKSLEDLMNYLRLDLVAVEKEIL